MIPSPGTLRELFLTHHRPSFLDKQVYTNNHLVSPVQFVFKEEEDNFYLILFTTELLLSYYNNSFHDLSFT